MKLTCPKSGIRYTVSEGFGSGRAVHPVFQWKLEYLISSPLEAALAGRVSNVDLHLLGSALINHFPLTEWTAQLDSPATLAPFWKSYIARIARLATRIPAYDPALLPQYAINKRTKSLHSFPDYIETLEAICNAHEFSPASINRNKHAVQYSQYLNDKILQILRTTDSVHRERKKLPGLIAVWAASVGKFPSFAIQFQNKQTSLADFWKHLIVLAFQENTVTGLLAADVKAADYFELLEHCQTNIPFGSLHIDVLIKKLQEAIDIIEEFKPKIISSQQIAEILLADGPAPNTELVHSVIVNESTIPVQIPMEPKRSEYKSQIEYLKARVAWSNSILAISKNNGVSCV